jgi:hypothetical protein
MLRRGNHSSAKFWRRVLLPVIERYRDRDIPKYFRGDSAFALPKLLRLLEKEGFRYAIRLKTNPVLQRKIAHLLKRPVGRPSRRPRSSTPASGIARGRGTRPAGWWRKWNGTWGNCSRVSASSSPTWSGVPSGWCGVTTRGVRRTSPTHTTSQARGGVAPPILVTIRVSALLELAVWCRQRLELTTEGAACLPPNEAQFPPAPEANSTLGNPGNTAAVDPPVLDPTAATTRSARTTPRPASSGPAPQGGRS